MQLNPEIPFSTQVNNLSGNDFEKIVASSLYYSGYHVDRNLTFGINKETVAEIDVVATLITPLNEIRIAIECKGANPSFNDLRKFSSIRKLLSLKEYFVELIVFGSNNTRPEHDKIADLLEIKLLKKSDLSKLVLPILWGTGELRSERTTWLNRYLAIYTIEDFYLKSVIDSIQNRELKKLFTGYRKYLQSDLWSITDPIAQLNDSFEKAQNEYNGFTNTIAIREGTTAYQQVTNPNNQIVQSAMLLELKHRVMNLNAIARCSIIAKTRQGREVISERTPVIRDSLNKLCDYNLSPSEFINFITRFIYLWGGIILKIDENGANKDLHQIAKETGISDENALEYLKLLFKIYQSGDGLFINNDQRFFMKYIPSALRALGLRHRKSVFGADYNESLFTQDNLNDGLLNESLIEIGGNDNLIFEI